MNTISQILPKTGRISGPEVGDGAKPDVPTTDRQNEKKKKKHRPFYEAVDAHARRRLMTSIKWMCIQVLKSRLLMLLEKLHWEPKGSLP